MKGFAGVVLGIWVLGLGIGVDAQGRGGGVGRGGGPEFPTEKQWVESSEVQRRVATAMKLAGPDLLPQAKMFCTPTGPQRMALARQAAGLPPIENYRQGRETARAIRADPWHGMSG